MLRRSDDFRSATLSGHDRAGLAGPLRATSGCEQSQQTNSLFDHLVGGQKQASRNRQVKLFRGFEINGRFKSGWGLYR